MNRTAPARIPLDDTDLVISVVEPQGAIDLRLWTQTGGVKFPSKIGITIPRYALRAVIDALVQATGSVRKEAPAAHHQPCGRGKVKRRGAHP